MNSFYLTDLIGIPVTKAFTKAAKNKQVQDSTKVSKTQQEPSVEQK